MVNSTQFLTIDEVHTPAERVHFLNQECVTAGLTTSLYTYFAGIFGVPLLLRTVHKRIPIPIEYKMASGALLSIVVSYFAGVHAKKKCEEDLKRQLDEKLMA